MGRRYKKRKVSVRAKCAKMRESSKKQRLDRKPAENEVIVEDMTEEEYSSLMNESVILQTEVEDEVDDTDSYFLQPLDVSQKNVNDLCWHKDAGKQFKSAYNRGSRATHFRDKKKHAELVEIGRGQAFSFSAWKQAPEPVSETKDAEVEEIIESADTIILERRMAELRAFIAASRNKMGQMRENKMIMTKYATICVKSKY